MSGPDPAGSPANLTCAALGCFVLFRSPRIQDKIGLCLKTSQ